MGLRRVCPGDNLPDEVNVVIEIPARSNPVKYEIDKDTHTMFVDRFMGTPMHYPCEYGYIPHTLSEDDDPVDVLVVCPFPLISGSVVRCRLIGMLRMTDEAGPDSKLLAVPVNDLTPMYKDVHSYQDLPKSFLAAIEYFFDHYKDLEKNKWVDIDGWSGAEEAKAEVLASVARYEQYQAGKQTT
jgi:inorganic pyrophosphatase